ncbi:uncharacterized protein si:ch211-149e23.4 isoform X1 [Myxocyprinus asiaticus]|uniref:uncharacterized protein si:ch211-149e23.4 isoform X1 n=1 Tax=Myxocyprinus asiaticus TaxID=70543 RepID=UPI00222351B1|nr:uncharacterized protein si:ch211-149e23.4 isoform X1 [Myxocyprinus asiaticus]
MGLPIFFILGMVLNLAHSRKIQDSVPKDLVLGQVVTGILGEEVYLHCLYTGQSKIMFSSWNRLDSSKSAKKMAGYKYNNIPFNRENFDIPASVTNLTVKLNVTSLDVEGEYTCVFNSDDDETKDNMLLKIIARPDIDITVKEEVVNGTLYQAVSCSAANAKPEAFISWEISGALPRDDIFSVNMINTTHFNGTTSSISVLRFPLIMNNQSTVTCIIQHPTFPGIKRANIEVDTFVSPVMTMETVLVQEGGEDFQEVICTATGGRPQPNITWMLPELKNAPPLQRNVSKADSVISSFQFQSDLYQGENITCIFGYMLLPFISTRTLTLPTYYLSSLQLKDHSLAMNGGENQTLLVFEEGDTNVKISMNVLGIVPSYKISCTKEGQPLPEDVDVVGSDVFIKGPIEEQHHAGQYICQASYRRHLASLQMKIEVNPKVILPETFAPNISLNHNVSSDHIYIECLASNGFPAANVSWILPQELNSTVQSDVVSCNRSCSVRSVVTVPMCMPREHKIECIVEHPLFTGKEGRWLTLSKCAPPNITLQSSIKWQSGIAYSKLVCLVESQSPAATITWNTECFGSDNSFSEFAKSENQESHMVTAKSVVQVPIYLFSGCTVTCMVKHRGLEKPENKSTDLPSLGPSESRLVLGEERYTHLWYAVCEYSGDGLKPNISWVLPGVDTIVQAPAQAKYNGIKVQVNSTFEFQLDQYEGKELICLIQNEHGNIERQQKLVPKYFISSIEILNKTTLDRRTHGQHEHRFTLQENLFNQKILLRAHGNAPSYKTQCYREDGSAACTEGMALVFPDAISELDAGLYICHVSYHHHKATFSLRVDVTSEETQHMIFITICFSSAAAITLILIVVLCVLCKPSWSHSSNKKNRRECESLAALMQDPRSSEKTVLPGGTGPDYAELVRYSIVFDAKSTV